LFRIVLAIGVPEENRLGSHTPSHSTRHASPKIKQLIDNEKPQQALAEFHALNVDQTAAILFMAKPKICGTTSFIAMQGQAIENANELAFFIGEWSCWLAIKCKSEAQDVTL
jgi:hypothetical protein